MLREITEMEIREISLVDDGANKRSFIFKRAGATEEYSSKSGLIFVKKAAETAEEPVDEQVNEVPAVKASTPESTKDTLTTEQLDRVSATLDAAEKIITDENSTQEQKVEAKSIIDDSIELLTQYTE